MEIQVLVKAVMRNANSLALSKNLYFRIKEKADTHQNTRCGNWETVTFKKQERSD